MSLNKMVEDVAVEIRRLPTMFCDPGRFELEEAVDFDGSDVVPGEGDGAPVVRFPVDGADGFPLDEGPGGGERDVDVEEGAGDDFVAAARGRGCFFPDRVVVGFAECGAFFFQEVGSAPGDDDAAAAVREGRGADDVLGAEVVGFLGVHGFEPLEEVGPRDASVGFHQEEPFNVGRGAFEGLVEHREEFPLVEVPASGAG